MHITMIDYLYRDADNHKAHGTAAFSGVADDVAWAMVREKLGVDGLFIAEQVGLPPLYSQLLRWSGGAPTVADHCWHEFVVHTVLESRAHKSASSIISHIQDFVEQVRAVESWDVLLSPVAETG